MKRVANTQTHSIYTNKNNHVTFLNLYVDLNGMPIGHYYTIRTCVLTCQCKREKYL